MAKINRPVNILLAEDDEEDRFLIEKAFEHVHVETNLSFVENGEELIAHLNNVDNQIPDLIFLDINMPKMNGKEALSIIKNDNKFKKIPIIIFTTSKSQEDIVDSYNLGTNSFIVKRGSFEKLVNVIKGTSKYWFNIVDLPTDH